ALFQKMKAQGLYAHEDYSNINSLKELDEWSGVKVAPVRPGGIIGPGDWTSKKFAGGIELYHGTSGSDIESIQTEGLDAGYGEDKFVYLTCIYDQAVSYARGSAEGQAADTFAIVVVNAAKIPKLKRIRTHEGIWTAPKVSPKAINRVDVYNVATGQKIASHKTP